MLNRVESEEVIYHKLPVTNTPFYIWLRTNYQDRWIDCAKKYLQENDSMPSR